MRRVMNSDATRIGRWLPRQLSSEGPRYLALVSAIEQDVQSGQLAYGVRLPPHRNLAQQLGLSVGTVSRAYQEAEQRGIVSSHVGQGTFIRRRPNDAAEARLGPVNMALNMPVKGSETLVLSETFAEVSRVRDLSSLLDYHSHGGIRQHREIIAASISEGAFVVDPSQLFLCNGAQHAIDIALRLVTRAGDSILVDGLTYSGFKAVAEVSHLKLVPVAMDREGLDPAALEAAARASGAKVLYCMPTLQSPTTRTMSLARRERIAKLAERLDLTIIEDDVYGFFFPERPTPITQLVPNRSFYITSYSKCVAPGFRLGTLTVPEAFAARTELLLHASTWFVAPMLSEVAVRLIETGRLESLLAERRRQAVDRYAMFAVAFPAAEKLRAPPFFGWLPLPEDWTAASFVAAARSRGIAVTPPMASMVGDIDPGGVRVCLGAMKDLAELSSILQVLREVTASRPANVLSVA